MILLAILLPPLYFLTQKKFGMFILTSAMFLLAVIFILTVVLIPGAFILWALAMIPAAWHYRHQATTKILEAHARKVGAEVAANLQRQGVVQPSCPPRL